MEIAIEDKVKCQALPLTTNLQDISQSSHRLGSDVAASFTLDGSESEDLDVEILTVSMTFSALLFETTKKISMWCRDMQMEDRLYIT